MKLQKQKTRKDKDYNKYVVVIPRDKIETAEFVEGDELEVEASKGEVRLRKK